MFLLYKNGTRVLNANEISNTNMVTFKEGEKAHFECSAVNAFPGPIVTVTIGDQDITNQFLINTSQSDGGTGTPGFIPRFHSAVAKVEDLVIKKEYGNKQLMCQGKNEGMDRPVAESMTINIQG